MIDPDERFLLLGSIRSDGLGNFDLYLAWNDHGTWSARCIRPRPSTRAHATTRRISRLMASVFSSPASGASHSTRSERPLTLSRARLAAALNAEWKREHSYQMDSDVLDSLRPPLP